MDPDVRPPAVAGCFYRADPDRLEAEVRSLLAAARPPRTERPLGLVAPHAGYAFSGLIAADAWHQAAGHGYDLVVLLGANHTVPAFAGAAIHPGRGFATPLGTAAIDRPAADALLAASAECAPAARPHAREHSIEVQLPFVQLLFPGVPILPAIVGRDDPGLCARLGEALARALAGRRALVAASSDLSHYPAYDEGAASDRDVLAAIARLDPAGLRRMIAARERSGCRGLRTCACGAGPVLAAIAAVRALGATRGVVVSRASSGDLPAGDRGHVVGYGAVVFDAGPPGADLAALDDPPHVLHSTSGRLP